MGLWIPGPRRYSWPAGKSRPPESPHQAAIAGWDKEEPKPRRTRRTKKTED